MSPAPPWAKYGGKQKPQQGPARKAQARWLVEKNGSNPVPVPSFSVSWTLIEA